jgi:PKD repeat protein
MLVHRTHVVWLAVLVSLAAAQTPRLLRADAVTDVVISELMYNPPSGDRQDDYLEIHNRSTTTTYNLAGWQFTSGVVFTFPSVNLGPGAYLVVCANETRVRQAYGITNTTGNWDPASTLDNGGERIKIVDAMGVEIEDLTYDDRNPWPILADGLGHSLERRRLDYDNDDPANWSASSTGSAWAKFSVTGLASSSRIYFYLTGAGTAFLDEVKIFPVGNPGDNRVANGGFESTNTSWNRTGTHSTSTSSTEAAQTGTRSMKIIATGPGDSQPNSIYQDGLGLVNNDSYTLEFWVRFSEPGQSLVARLSSFDNVEDPIYLEAFGGGASPGRRNAVDTTDLPPFVYPIEHVPEAPVASSPVAVRAFVRDDVSVASVTLHWDPGTGERTAVMFDDGAHSDDAAGDGIFGAAIGTFGTGSIVRYWVTALDGAGQDGSFPFEGNPTPTLGFYIQPNGINPTFPLRSNTGLTSTKPPVYHFLINSSQLADEPSLPGTQVHLNGSLTTYRQATFVYNGEVFDNVRVRHRGQSSLGRPKKHWKLDFNKDHRFLTPFEGHPEVDNINVQSSEGDKSFLREYLSYKAFLDVGLPGLEMWHVRLYINGVYRGLYIHLENPDDDWLDRSGLDPEGWLWKSYSQAQSGSTSNIELEEGVAATANAALGSFFSSMNSLTGQALVDYINANMDVPAFVDFLALHQLMHNADHPAKNYLIYADEDAPAGTWTYLLWDADLTHGRNFECSGGGVWNDTMRSDMWGDPQLLFGTSVRPKCDGPWNGVINGFLQRTTVFRDGFYARTQELLTQLYHPNVLNPIIDNLSAPLETEVAMDWQLNPPTYGTRNSGTVADYRYHVDQMQTWAVNRNNVLQNTLSNLGAPDVANVVCTRAANNVSLTWTNRSSQYDEIRVFRNNALVQTLAPTVQATTVALDLGQTVNTFRVASVYRGSLRTGQSCSVVIGTGGFTKVIDEDFNTAVPAAELAVNCNAAQRSSRLELTEPAGGQAGTAYFRTKYPIDSFVADFDLRFDEPSATGADGMVFIVNTGNDPTACGAGGGAMGYLNADGGTPVVPGYAIVFDTWQNAGEVSHNWCGFYDAAANPPLRQAADVPEEFNGNGTFHARVIADGGVFTLLLGNASIGMAERQILRFTVPAFQLGRDAHFGFSAGTGGAFARHSADNFCLQIETGPEPPVAAFVGAPLSGLAPLQVQFTNQSTGQITTRSWNFGDSTTSTSTNPLKTYQNPGTYTVSLTVTGPGGSDTETKQGYISVSNPVMVTSDFSATPTIGRRPLAVTFTNQSTNATSYLWSFGDGTTSTMANPVHTYSSAGQFSVSLQATGAGGSQDSESKTNYIRVDDILDAEFIAAPISGTAPLRVQFANQSAGTTIQSFLWDFGDGVLATDENPFHTYTQNGVYTVRLQIFGFQSTDSETKSGYIRVGQVGGVFIRGDSNGDGTIDLSDAVAVLNFLFIGTGTLDCHDAGDADDNGVLELTDAVRILGFLFQGLAAPPQPHPLAGTDPTVDALPECERGV